MRTGSAVHSRGPRLCSGKVSHATSSVDTSEARLADALGETFDGHWFLIPFLASFVCMTENCRYSGLCALNPP